MFRKLIAVAIVVGASFVGVQASVAQAAEKPKPEWSMSGQKTQPANGTNKTNSTEALPWSCHGYAYQPHSITGGIGFDGRQECFGAFDVQKVCIKLQELDYYGTYYDRTSYVCSAETVANLAYKSSSVTCAGALEGTFRTFARGYAWPDGVQTTRTGYSAGVRLCIGY
jgi:hypothetical protein